MDGAHASIVGVVARVSPGLPAAEGHKESNNLLEKNSQAKYDHIQD